MQYLLLAASLANVAASPQLLLRRWRCSQMKNACLHDSKCFSLISTHSVSKLLKMKNKPPPPFNVSNSKEEDRRTTFLRNVFILIYE